jgi:hypothetical protein
LQIRFRILMDQYDFWKLDPGPDPPLVKSWIRIRCRVNINKLTRLKIEPWRTGDSHSEGLEAQNRPPEGR